MQAEFVRHASAASALYADIYAIAEQQCGLTLPAGCPPLQAVKLIAAEVTRLRTENATLRREAAELVDALEVAGQASFVAGMRARGGEGMRGLDDGRRDAADHRPC